MTLVAPDPEQLEAVAFAAAVDRLTKLILATAIRRNEN